jgi:hypothetical protein
MRVKKQQRLSKRQLAVIDDLFAGEMEESQVLEKHKVSSRLYRKWLADEVFAGELAFRIESARRAGELIIARYTPMAAAKLVSLTESDKVETVRKACLDIMSSVQAKANPADADSAPSANQQHTNDDLPPELAGKLLEVLAEHSKQVGRSHGSGSEPKNL